MAEHPLVKKMAQAINLVRDGDVLGYDMARAALNVVAEWEPSDGMMDVGTWARVHPSVYMSGPPKALRHEVTRIYRAMREELKRETGLS